MYEKENVTISEGAAEETRSFTRPSPSSLSDVCVCAEHVRMYCTFWDEEKVLCQCQLPASCLR